MGVDRRVTSWAHDKAHTGYMYTMSRFITAMADAAALDFTFLVGATFSCHSEIQIAGGGDAHFQFFEDVTVSADGSALSCFNHNLASSLSTTAIGFSSATVSTTGSLKWETMVPGGTGGNAVGGQGSSALKEGAEIILAKNKKYLFRVQNRSGAVKAFSFNINYYEAFSVAE